MKPQSTLTALPGLRQAEGRKGMGKPCSLGRIGSCRALKHFIQTCYEHLEESAHKFKERDQADELACDRRRRSLESSSQTCAEETLVREVSQHGAALTCSFPVIVGELVKIERMDTGERVEGIVRWRERRDGNTLHLGLEFSRCNNFWRLHW